MSGHSSIVAVSFGLNGDEDIVRARVEQTTALVDEVMAQRAEDRVGQIVEVLIEGIEVDDDEVTFAVGRSGHQGPDDGATAIVLGDADEAADGQASVAVGDMVRAVVVGTEGVDLIAELIA